MELERKILHLLERVLMIYAVRQQTYSTFFFLFPAEDVCITRPMAKVEEGCPSLKCCVV